MGSRVMSIAFQYNESDDNLIKLTQSWLESELLFQSDTSWEKEFLIYRKDNLVIIDNFPVFEILEHSEQWERILEQSSLQSDWFITFLYITTSDNYGYALYEKNKHIRTGTYYSDDDISTFKGLPIEIEQPFLSAPFYYTDEEESQKFNTIPENDGKTYYKILQLADGEEIFEFSMISQIVQELSIAYLGFDIAWDVIPFDKEIKLKNTRYIPFEERYSSEVEKKSCLQRFIHFFKSQFLNSNTQEKPQ